ncbi:MAG: DUF4340 domain-containing protein, partial [Kiritimatiellae bacterium]|nr:DUF4340 domain-containing protein [Kiritimatiellia bacterium]
MSNLRTTTGLLIACLAGAMLVWVLNRPAMRAPRPHGRAERIFDAPLREVDYLLIERNGLRAELRRESEGWALTQPLSAFADATVVQRLLDACERAPVNGIIAADELSLRELSLADFGLLAPQARLIVAGPRMRTELLLGTSAAISNELFACLDQSGDVLVTEGALLDAVPETLNALRDTGLYRGDTRRVVGLSLRRPALGFVKLTRGTSGWQMTQPFAARADDAAIQGILDQLASARIARFIWPAAATNGEANPRTELLSYGLDGEDSDVQIQIWEGGDPVGQRFRLGKPVVSLADHVYAMPPDGLSVVAVTGALLRAAMQPVDELRDKRLFAAASGDVQTLEVQGLAEPLSLRRGAAGTWELIAPVADRADQPTVARLLDELLHLRATAFDDSGTLPAQAAAAHTVRIDLATVSDSWRLLIEQAPDASDAWLVFTNAPTRYRVPGSQVENVLGLLADVPAQRDRTVLAIPAGVIRRLTVQRASGRLERLDRDGSDAWRPSDPAPTLDRPAPDDWLE